jgi:hypothetical protein
MAMGLATALGPGALYGDTLTWVIKGRDFLDSFIKGGVGGQWLQNKQP